MAALIDLIVGAIVADKPSLYTGHSMVICGSSPIRRGDFLAE